MAYLLSGIFQASAPLRIPVAGGGTDLPEYYKKNEAEWLSLAFDKRIMVVAYKSPGSEFAIYYKNQEVCKSVTEIKHPIVKGLLQHFKIEDPIVIHSASEMYGNSGLGSSSVFTLCLAKVLCQITGKIINNLPEFVFNFERDILKEYVGKQDAYAAFYGGLNSFRADKAGTITAESFLIPNEVNNFCEHLLLVKAGADRLANDSLKKQANGLSSDYDFEEKYHKIKEIALKTKDILINKQYLEFGKLMNEHWKNKCEAFSDNFDKDVFIAHEELMNAFATGVKLCGAGGSGYMLALFDSIPNKKNYIYKTNRQVHEIKADFRGLL